MPKQQKNSARCAATNSSITVECATPVGGLHLSSHHNYHLTRHTNVDGQPTAPPNPMLVNKPASDVQHCSLTFLLAFIFIGLFTFPFLCEMQSNSHELPLLICEFYLFWAMVDATQFFFTRMSKQSAIYIRHKTTKLYFAHLNGGIPTN